MANNNAESTAKDEQSWRKRFAEIDYKIGIAKKELDVLQRELNLLQVHYYANPATGMKEGFTRRDINQHRADIDA